MASMVGALSKFLPSLSLKSVSVNVMRWGKKCPGGYAGETGDSKQMALQALPTGSHSTSGALGRNHTWAFKHVVT